MLRDAYLDRPLVLGARVRLGQFKPYFSRQQLTRIIHLELTSRSVTAAFHGITRDLGASLHREPEPEHAGIEWAVGVFDGGGIGSMRDASGRPLAVARLGWTSAHLDGYREGDLDGSRPGLAIAVAYAGDLGHFSADAVVHTFTADAVVKAYGLALSGAAFARNTAEVGGRETHYGWYAQTGYMIVPGMVEVVGRVGRTRRPGETQQEVLGGLNLYGRGGHDSKLQLEGGATRLAGDAELDWVVRAQTQLAF